MPNGVSYWTGLGEEPKPTLQVMDFFIRRAAREPWCGKVAKALTAGCTTPEEEASAIWKAVKTAVTYAKDPWNVEWIQDPIVTWAVAKKGDCDDMATLAGAFLASLGHSMAPLAVQWNFRAVPSHAVVRDLTAGVIVDPVTNSPDQWPPWPVKKLIRV